MKEIDQLQRFLFEHASIRGEIAHLDRSYRTILQQHPYPTAVKSILGEALVACSLLASSIKFEGDISLQFHGDKRLPLLLVQCTHQFQLRAFAKYQEESATIDYHSAFLQGKMLVNLNQDNQTKTYQSIIPIVSTAMEDNLTHYFNQSEQITSRVWLATNEGCAAGMLLQLMPGQDSLQREQFWEYAVHLGQTLRPDELLTLDNHTLLYRLYHETQLRLFPARPVTFRCRCTHDKMRQVLRILGEQELQTMLQEQGHITIACDFCNQQYSFDAIDVTLLFRD